MKIGLFDSGFGGLTIYRSIRAQLPVHDIIYLGDNARAPYGHRAFDTIYQFAVEAVQFLCARDCKLIVMACNTASARALRRVQQQLFPHASSTRRVLGVIRPLVEAVAASDARAVALWGTRETVRSDSYAVELAKLRPDLRLAQTACPMLVPLVENGELAGPGLEYFVRKYWDDTIARAGEVDTLLLACTHYPLILPAIKVVVGDRVRVLVQGPIVAASLEDYLRRHPEIDRDLTRLGRTEFLTTDQSEDFDRLAAQFLGEPIESERISLT